jgi:hypothetical protein
MWTKNMNAMCLQQWERVRMCLCIWFSGARYHAGHHFNCRSLMLKFEAGSLVKFVKVLRNVCETGWCDLIMLDLTIHVLIHVVTCLFFFVPHLFAELGRTVRSSPSRTAAHQFLAVNLRIWDKTHKTWRDMTRHDETWGLGFTVYL